MGGITTVDYAGEKWGGTPHYRGKVYRLGDDEHGTWVWGPSGRTVSRGDQLAFVTGQDLVAVIPTSDWWSATWWLGHPEVSLYVNIQTPVEHRPGAMTYVDLDLDVVRPRPARSLPAAAPVGQGCARMIEELERIAGEARTRIEAASTLDDLAEAERATLGKKGSLKDFKRRLGGLDPGERKQVGQAVNEAIESLEAVVDERRHGLHRSARSEQLEADRLDLTETLAASRAGHLHLVTQAIMELEDVFVGLGFTVAEGPEVETDFYNFEALNFPEGHPARDMYDTLYVDFGEPGRTLLRTHTSPVQVRVMQEQPPPIYSVMPGRTFRQDTADATHLPVFHQIEGLVVDRGITLTDLAGTIDRFTKAYFGGEFSSRLRPAYFPFTEPSAEFDIIRPDGTFLELGGCGMVHPNVLRNCGIDPEEFTGFAFGFGIERLAVTKAGVDDLRELITNDVRFLRQF